MNTIAIYAGSFDPYHVGHDNIRQRAERVFGRGNVMIARGINPEKHNTDGLTTEELVDWCINLEEKINCEVNWYKGFLHEFIQKLEDEDTNTNFVLLRGLRNATDLAYEENQIKFIREFKPNLRVVFMMCDPEFNHISSSAIRNLNKIKPGAGNQFIV
jgi:pantetheine-phosphate adenylyltransferase